MTLAPAKPIPAYVMPDDDAGPVLARDCTCETCRRARWWWNGPAPRHDHRAHVDPEHDSIPARAGEVAYRFSRWLEKFFIDTPPHRKRESLEQRRAAIAAEVWTAMLEVIEVEQLDIAFLDTAEVLPPSSGLARELGMIADQADSFHRQQLRFHELTGFAWADLALEPWESVEETLSPLALELLLVEVEHDVESWREIVGA